MLPPLTSTGKHVGIACVLEPAYEVAGDAFDYAVNAGVLHLGIFDAMGHGLEASRMASLTVAAYRWARRRDLDLPETFRAMDEALSAEFGEEQFVTAQFGTLDPERGTLRWLNAGHPAPLLLRRGRVSTEEPVARFQGRLGHGGGPPRGPALTGAPEVMPLAEDT